jgi:hypothetical protein
MIVVQRTAYDVRGQDPNPNSKHLLTWSFDHSRDQIRCAYYVARDPIFRDSFTKLEDWAKGTAEISA